MSQVLTESAKELLREPVLAHIATIDADGRPNISPVWVDVDGDDVLFNTAEGRVKTKNLRSNPNVAVSVVDPQDPQRVVALRGKVAEMTHDGADEHIDFLAKKYLDADSYPFRQPGQQRIKFVLRPERVHYTPPR